MVPSPCHVTLTLKQVKSGTRRLSHQRRRRRNCTRREEEVEGKLGEEGGRRGRDEERERRGAGCREGKGGR